MRPPNLAVAVPTDAMRPPIRGDGFAWGVLAGVEQALFFIDSQWRLIWANPHAERFFELDLQQGHGQTVWRLFPETVDTRIERTYRAAMEQQVTQRSEVYYPPTQHWFHVRAIPFSDGLLVSYNDITRRKSAEKQVRDQARIHREMTEHLSDVLTRSVAGGEVFWVSPSMTEVLGWTLADFDGHALNLIVLEDDMPIVAEKLSNAEVNGDPIDVLLRVRHKLGGVRHMHVRGRMVPSSTRGGPPELVLSSRDVTERVESRQLLEKALTSAEAATRAKSAFLANMSHEIRTPLHGVIGMTSLLMDSELSEQQRSSLEVIRTSGETLLNVINDVLDLSKIEANALHLVNTEFDLRRCVEEALDLVTGQAAAKGLELAYFFEVDVPTSVRADGGRLKQVLANLLGNAVKFTKRGEVVVRAEVVSRQGTHSVLRLLISDTGPGIARDRQDDLFLPFTQLDNSYTRRHGGTGLGLSISQRLVELMGGEISLESEAGAGATFAFTLPVEIVPSQGRLKLTTPVASLEGLRVLIVDDNAVNRQILLRLCESWHMAPIAFATGGEALRWLERGPACDLALLDMQMPGMDGRHLARSIGALRPNLSLVVLSSVGDQVDVPEAFAKLSKPVKQTRLYEILVTHFGERRVVTSPALPIVTRPATPRPILPLRVLLAEDNEVNQLVGQMMLARMGIDADVVTDGGEAISAVAGSHYDVVLMDVQMPKIDGIEATREIRKNGGMQPWIVALTASALEDDRQRCLAAGMDDHLAKPMTQESLEATLVRAAEERTKALAGR
ncbi:MAG: response regulator [Myxococcales bacterium]|nr:response regulator [Myxococcales bacterium]